MTASLDMIRGRSNIVTLTNNSGGALVAGDVCIQDTTGDEYVTTTTSAASTAKVFIAAESISSAASGKFYESGYCPFVNVSASVTRGRFLFTHTVAKQAAESATYGAGAFGKIIKSGTSPSAIIYSATAQISGGGAAITEGAYASLPAGTDNDVYLATDGHVLLHKATTWKAWGPIHPLTLPPAISGNWTWDNQGTSTADDTTGVISMVSQIEAGPELRVLYKAQPTPPYSITALVSLDLPYLVNYAGAGIGFRESGTGRYIFFGPTNASGAYGLDIWKWNSTTSADGTYLALGGTGAWWQRPVWLRIRNDGSNLVFYLSNSGLLWQQVYSSAKNNFFTTDSDGVCMLLHQESAVATQAVFWSWAAT